MSHDMLRNDRRVSLRAGRRRLGVKTLAATVAIALVPAATAMAGTMGNDPIDRANLDTFTNFTVVDQSNSADSDGLLNEISYYAKLSSLRNQGAVAFAVVRGDQTTGFKVIWISGNIAKPAASGLYSYVPATPIPLKAGDNLALYHENQGLVPYTLVNETDPALWEYWEPNNSGKPAVGETLSIEDPLGTGAQHKRNYSVQGSTTDCAFSVEQPINGDGSSVFRRRGVIPVKLAPTCGDGTLAPTITITYEGDSTSGSNEAVASVSSADSGATMRWDASGGHYIYNLATSDKQAGEYTLHFNIGGVEAASVTFGLS